MGILYFRPFLHVCIIPIGFHQQNIKHSHLKFLKRFFKTGFSEFFFVDFSTFSSDSHYDLKQLLHFLCAYTKNWLEKLP